MARDTTVDRVLHHAAVRGDRIAFRAKQGNTFVPFTFRAYGEACRAFAAALVVEGCAPGDAVAIMGANSPEWVIADVGAMLARCVPAGIYPTCTPEQLAYIAGHCEAKVVVLENRELWGRLRARRDALPALRRVVLVRDAEAIDDPLVTSFQAFLDRGRAHGVAADERLRALDPREPATLIYTSGTTGPPKGAVLSHANLAFMARSAYNVNAAAAGGLLGPRTTEDDSIVSYLPLSHIAEQMFTIHVPAMMAAEVLFAEALEKLKEALVAGRPTLFLGVPRVWEKFKAALEARLKEATGRKADVVRWARRVGLEASRERLARGSMSARRLAEYTLADRLFYSKLKAQLGLDRLRLAMTGAAPIAQEVVEFFLSCGITIYEVYGQTEGSGGTTFNQPTPRGTKLGTVGRPLPGITVKIAEDGEILVRTPGAFLGYHKDEAATKATLVDGWLATGDVGELDADGFLRITDRKKDLLVTSGGKNVAPQNLEQKLKLIDGVAQAVVIGDQRKYLSALITLDEARVRALAKERGWPDDLPALLDHGELRAHLQAGVDAINAELARYETIKKFVILPRDFTLEAGEVTPTQKIKRKVVVERYAREIEGMYTSAD